MKTEPKPTEQLSPCKAPAILARLKDAQAKLKSAQARRKIIALDALDGDIAGHLAKVKSEIAALTANIEDLSGAYDVALELDEAEKRRQHAEHYKSEIRSCRQHLIARDKAALAMSVALEDVMKQWKILIEHSEKARQSIVIGQWPNCNVYTDFTKIKEAVEQELYRLGGDPTLGNKRKFPGGNPHDMAMLGQPEKIVPITEKLSTASKYLIDTLSGKVVE